MKDRQYPLYHKELEHDSCGVGAVVDLAKAVLMKQRGLTEPEAHRSMQQYAMNHGMKMVEYAAQILETSRETEGH